MSHDLDHVAADHSPSPSDGIDPWAALQDGRRQLLAILDACDLRIAARVLTIPEFAALGEATAPVADHLREHAARDRAHARFFASIESGTNPPSGAAGATPPAPPVTSEWANVVEEVKAARSAMLEAAAALSPAAWERLLSPPWAGAVEEPLTAMLLVRAMCDGILAAAIDALDAPDAATR